MSRLLCFGLGYSARHLARRLAREGWQVTGTARTQQDAQAIAGEGFTGLSFDGTQPGVGLDQAIESATHILVSVPPGGGGDPVLAHHAGDIAQAPALGWIGYLSTVGVYGDHQGGWVDETTPASPISQRSRHRVAAEAEWLALGQESGKQVQIFRLAGIYGPGRSAIERLRAGTAQRIIKPGQVFNRIHVADIVEALCAVIAGLAPDLQSCRRRAGAAAGRHRVRRAAIATATSAGDRLRGCRSVTYGEELLCGEQAREQRAPASRSRAGAEIPQLS